MKKYAYNIQRQGTLQIKAENPETLKENMDTLTQSKLKENFITQYSTHKVNMKIVLPKCLCIAYDPGFIIFKVTLHTDKEKKLHRKNGKVMNKHTQESKSKWITRIEICPNSELEA